MCVYMPQADAEVRGHEVLRCTEEEWCMGRTAKMNIEQNKYHKLMVDEERDLQENQARNNFSLTLNSQKERSVSTVDC